MSCALQFIIHVMLLPQLPRPKFSHEWLCIVFRFSQHPTEPASHQMKAVNRVEATN